MHFCWFCGLPVQPWLCKRSPQQCGEQQQVEGVQDNREVGVPEDPVALAEEYRTQSLCQHQQCLACQAAVSGVHGCVMYLCFLLACVAAVGR